MEIPGFGWISVAYGRIIDDEGEDHRAGLAGGASPHEPEEQPMKTDLGPCAVCGTPVFDQDGAAYNVDGEVIHPPHSFCYDHAWGDVASLSERNTQAAEMLGRLVALGTKTTSGKRRHVEIVLWLRNLTADDREPPDGVVLEWSREGARVALIPEYERARAAVDELEERPVASTQRRTRARLRVVEPAPTTGVARAAVEVPDDRA